MRQPLPSAPRGKLLGVEALRGIAAMLVVAFHAAEILAGRNSYGTAPFGHFWAFGRAGVDFFFVLSGFIITFIHFGDIGHPRTMGAFWRKRLLRIYPTWWIVAALYSALLFISPTPGRAEQDWVHALFSFLLLPEPVDPILGVGWSLRHELLFYAIFSVLLLQREIGAILLGIWGLGIAANMQAQMATGAPLFHGLADLLVFRGFNVEFFFGIATAVLVRFEIGGAWRTVAALGALGFLATGMVESYTPEVMHEWPVQRLAYAATAAMVLYGVALLDRNGQSRVPRLLVRLGAASYSIYLLHIPVLLVLEYALRPVRDLVPPELAFIAIVAAAIGAATVFSEAVEQPLLALGRQPRARAKATQA